MARILAPLLVVLLLPPSADAKSLTAIANTRVTLPLRFSNPVPSAASPTQSLDGALAHPTTVPVSETAMPFVRIDKKNQSLSVEEATMNALAALPAPVCVLGMAGTARDGKSTFLNMFAHWLRSRWATEGAQGANFPVGHDLDACTEGAWVRIFKQRDGEPLPGTECLSVVLVDTQGVAKGSMLAVNRLFSLSLSLSSTVALNVMRQFNDDTLERLGGATAQAQSTGVSLGEHAPNLVVLLRDARLRMKQAGRHISADGMLHAALQPAGDALDKTRRAIRQFFANHTMVEMKQPDEHDLRSIESWGLPQVGRPFHTSFISAAEHVLASLQPKAVRGAMLNGETLAATAYALVEQINQGVQISLGATVDALRHSQASDAVAASRRAFRDALPEPVRQLGDGVRNEGGGATAAALVLSPASIELRLRNATQAAISEFAARAPDMGSRARLQPYVDQLKTSIQAMQRELRQTHENAVRLSAVHASRVQLEQKQEEKLEEQQQLIDRLLEQQRLLGKFSVHELLGNVAVVALGATAMFLPQLPQGLMMKVAPIVRGTPVVLSALGVWRVARQRVSRYAGIAMRKVQEITHTAPNASHTSSHSAAAAAFAAAATGSSPTVARA